MAKMKGKHALMEMLMAEGVEYIFGNPGTSEGPMQDALEGYPELKYVLTTQEGVAMGMADGYARATGRPSFVSLHIETGLANGISLLHNAHQGGTPLVLTSANKDVRNLAGGRTDLAEMVRLFTKWSAEVTHPQQAPGVLRRAFKEAKTPPMGPTYVGFSLNALDEEGEVDIFPSPAGYFRIAPDRSAVEDAADILASASRPAMVVGDRLAQSGGTAEAVRVAEILGARVYAGSYSEMNFPSSHPQFLGLIAAGTPAAREKLASADTVLVVGLNAFPGDFYYHGSALAPGTKLVHVDSSALEVGKTEATDVGIIADPRTALTQLADALREVMSGAAMEAARSRAASVGEEKAAQEAAWQERLKRRWDQRPIAAERLMAEVADALPSDGVIIDDSISHRDAVLGAIAFDEPGSIYGERGGAIGWGMGGAMGVKLANPDRPVVAIVGDGTAMMTIQALWTANNSGIPVVYVVCNNRSYRILKVNMNAYKTQVLSQGDSPSQYIGMDFPVPLNISGIAEALGVYGRKIEDPSELAPALRYAIELGEPAVLDVVIDGSV